MHLLNLPNELLLAVANEVEYSRWINSLARTCRHLYNLLRVHAYLGDFEERMKLYGWSSEPIYSENDALHRLRASINGGSELSRDYGFYARIDFKSTNHALKYTSRWAHVPVTAFLLQNGAAQEKDQRPSSSWVDAFYHAIKNGDEETTSLFIEHGANVNGKKSTASHDHIFWNCTPLHFASGRASPKLVSLLLENGADVRAQDGWGRTPLQWAVMLQDRYFQDIDVEAGDLIATVKLLSKYGADVRAKDQEGICPLDYARSYPEINFRSLLEIGTFREAHADYLENVMQSQLQASGSWT